MKRLLILLAALLWPAAALAQDPPVDPRCPQGDLQTPRLPGSVCIGRMSPAYQFAFIYPREIAEIPALVRLLRAEARRNEAWIATEARRFRRERSSEAFPLSFEEGWHLDADTNVLVAASANIQHYTGGAHGGIEYRALLLDRRRGRPLALGDIFADLDPLQIDFCEALQREVRERVQGESPPFCPELATLPVTLTGGEEGQIVALIVLLAPYVVGSWAEGPYEIHVLLTDPLRALVRPAYRSAF